MTVRPTIRRSDRLADLARGHMAACAAGRCLTACVVVLLLVFLAALPDDVAAMPASPHRGVAAMQTQMTSASGASTRAAFVSTSLTDADLPPGDGRDLRQVVPVLVRPAVSTRFAIAVCVDPSPARSALPERPPRAA